MQVLLAQPRGFCAGVNRAIAIVEKALAVYGSPIYVRHEIVHNKTVVNELKEKGEECDLDTIAQDIKDRDERDMNRETAPLKKAEDAVLVDSSYMTIPEVVSEICSHCK